MEQEYNFNRVGKKMPYAMPDDFFSEMQANVLAQVAKEERTKRRHRAKLIRIYVAAASIAASVCLVCVLGHSLLGTSVTNPSAMGSSVQHEAVASMASVDKAFDNLSAEDQQDLNATYANDVYLSME